MPTRPFPATDVRAYAILLFALMLLHAAAIAQGQQPPASVGIRDSVSVGPDDGRFTIGAGGKRLMYGYPIPFSTSHFVLSVDGKIASNNPRLSGSTARPVRYISGRRASGSQPGAAQREIQFMFGGVRVTQRLVRVGGNFRPVGSDAPAQFYRIEYEIENVDDSLHAVGLLLLIDTMIDDNDACQMDADGTRVRREQMMAGKEVPSQILIYRTAGSKKDMTGVLVTDAGEAPRPDTLYIGRWPELHSVVWEVSMADRTYDDSAILQKWSPTVLAPGKTRRIATHYGLPQPGDLNILNNEKLEQLTYTVYFGPGQSAVNGKARREIAAILRGKQVEGVVVSAHADASGDDRANMAMSKRRLASLRNYLRGHRIPASAIVPKAFGESNADQSVLAQRRGKAQDRKVDLVVYVKDTEGTR